MVIRSATMDDLAAVRRLYRLLFASGAALQPGIYCAAEVEPAYPVEMIQAEDSDILVAEVEGLVVGFACVRTQQAVPYAAVVPRSYAMLVDLAVDPQYRRRGVATGLIEAVKAWAAERGFGEVELMVLAENAEAQRLYEACGFRVASQTLRYRLGGDGKNG